MPMLHPTGRKSKYSSDTGCTLLMAHKGLQLQGCLRHGGGISYETFRTWQSEKSVFSVAIKKAEAECSKGDETLDGRGDPTSSA